MVLDTNIRKQIELRGIHFETIVNQINTFREGVRPAELVRPCTIGDGVEFLEGNVDYFCRLYESDLSSKQIIKFVPASGAASRMFGQLLAAPSDDKGRINKKTLLQDAERGDSNSEAFLLFIKELEKFAFYSDLVSCLNKYALSVKNILEEGFYNEVLDFTLGSKGLNYANLPKGLIKFHTYPDGSRTAFEEHLVEALDYSVGAFKKARVHFTVSPDHLHSFKALAKLIGPRYERDGIEFEITFSIQNPSTDTIAVDIENKPFLDAEGKIVLRPGGHGVLLDNLNEIYCDIAFIKNIDNVVPDRIKQEMCTYKKALGGMLIDIQSKVSGYLKELEKGRKDVKFLDRLARFALRFLNTTLPEGFEKATEEAKVSFLYSKLNRPIRVCGVVRNEGEPGGGPFWVRNEDRTLSKQIIESAQVDVNSDAQRSIWESSTHFNPVDIVCGLRDYQGNPFNLTEYSDPSTAFISIKSKDGRSLKALELPGLWNGSMAYWNTTFVEVPLITFNPVKTLLDLLRPEHQNEKNLPS